MTEERKQELRRLLKEAKGSLVVQYENSPRAVPVPVYRLYLEERWSYYGIDFLSQAFSVRFKLDVANSRTKLRLLDYIRAELVQFIEEDATADYNLLCIKAANYLIESDSTHGRRLYNHGLGALPVFMFLERLLEIALVRGIEEAVSLFARCSRGEGTQVFLHVIALLEGIKLESMIEVYPGARLVPLPSPEISGKMEQCLIGLPMWAFVNEKDSFFGRVLLVIDCPGHSIFHRPSERAFQDGTHIEDLAFPVQIPDVEFTTWDAAHSFKEIFRQAMSLVCDSAIETVFEGRLFEQDRSFILHLGGSDMLRYANRSNTSTEVGEAEIDEAKRLYRILEGKPDLRERLRIPIDRWIMSKTSKRDIDKIIDLGIALEALYVTREDRIQKQLCHRGSLYLGKSETHREALGMELKAIYDYRSDVVHNRALGNEVTIGTKTYSVADLVKKTQCLCRASILMFIKAGGFPDWNKVRQAAKDKWVSS